jgi:hypothetical protein
MSRQQDLNSQSKNSGIGFLMDGLAIKSGTVRMACFEGNFERIGNAARFQ